MNQTDAQAPEAVLLLSTQCSHCPTVLQGLSELVKQGVISRLEVVNIGVRPDIAERHGIRSVPWVKIGDFELEGLHSPAELRRWAERYNQANGLAEYFTELFNQGLLPRVLKAVRTKPGHLNTLLKLSADPDTDLTTRIGISAVVEDFEGTQELQQYLDEMIALGHNDDPRVRSDACHFLAQTRSSGARAALQELTRDPQRAVREVAAESLQELEEYI